MRVVTPKTQKGERGDTIIEVLICILVISMILAGAFASTNKNLQSVRDSQERAQAIKIAESQLERLRTNGGSGTFCFNTTANTVQATTAVSTSCYYNRQGVYLTASGAAATQGDIKDLYSSTSGVIYKVYVVQTVATRTFEISVKWVNAKSQLSQTKMYYRLAT